MAYTDIDDSVAFFNTNLYTGNNTATSHTVGFQPDWTWLKVRNATGSHFLFDSVRGATKYVRTNNTGAEGTIAETLKSFDSNGYTVGDGNSVNSNNEQMVGWNWKAGTTSGISGSADITPNAYSFNQTSGFSIVTYNGTDVNGNTVLHGLGAVPHFMIVKRRVGNGYEHVVYHKDDVAGLYLNSDGNNNDSSSTNIWFNGNTPTSTQFHIGTDGRLGDNVSTGAFVAYSFAPKQGYSKFGVWAGDGNADGPFIYTGFKPAFILEKRTDAGAGWNFFDNKRLGYNGANYWFVADNAEVEQTDATGMFDILSNGFKVRSSFGSRNASGGNYIYMAFAEAPLVGTNGVTAKAR